MANYKSIKIPKDQAEWFENEKKNLSRFIKTPHNKHLFAIMKKKYELIKLDDFRIKKTIFDVEGFDIWVRGGIFRVYYFGLLVFL